LLISATKATTSANASPFVVAIKNAHIDKLDHIINGCILVFIFSAANSDLYIGSRTLYGLAVNGQAPQIFARTNKYGIPYFALALCSAFCCLAYMSVSANSQTIFAYFVNVVSIFGLLTWISIIITFISFNRALKAQGIPRSALPYAAPFFPYGPYIALFFCVLILFIKNFTVFINGFDYKQFITGYIGIPVYVIAFVGHVITRKSKFRKPEEVDLVTLKHFVDEEEVEAEKLYQIKREKLKGGKKDGEWFYETFIGWLF
jgi:amino acid transporter